MHGQSGRRLGGAAPKSGQNVATAEGEGSSVTRQSRGGVPGTLNQSWLLKAKCTLRKTRGKAKVRVKQPRGQVCSGRG